MGKANVSIMVAVAPMRAARANADGLSKSNQPNAIEG
jgi:hypothetical protein